MATTFSQKSDQPIQASVTIAASASLSDVINLKGYTLVSLLMPAAWTTGSITVKVSYDGTTYLDLYNADGTEYTITAAASQAIILPPSDFATVSYIKLRSGTSGTPVTQAAERIITLIGANV